VTMLTRRIVTPGTRVIAGAGFSPEWATPGGSELAFHPYRRVEVRFMPICVSLTGGSYSQRVKA
jgi:hypothetical protein